MPASNDKTISRAFYRPELDALRFFAFLCIFFHHNRAWSSEEAAFTLAGLRHAFGASLRFAVSLFFLLSGYLITTLLVMEKRSAGRIHIGDFYKRRVVRIWPLYYSFIALVLLLGIVVRRLYSFPTDHLLPGSHALLAYLFFSGNWFLVFGGLAHGPLAIFWSVNIEEQFYLAWPLVANFCRQRILLLVSVALLVISYAVLLWLGAHGAIEIAVRFNTFVEMQFFAAGALLALWLPQNGLSMAAPFRLALGAAGILMWVAGTWLFGGMLHHASPVWWMPAALYLSVLAGCIALFLSFFGAPRQWFPQPLLWLGKISYGLYLYHVLVLTLLPHRPKGFVHLALYISCALLLTILLSGISYHWLERPFLQWKKRFTFVPNRPV